MVVQKKLFTTTHAIVMPTTLPEKELPPSLPTRPVCVNDIVSPAILSPYLTIEKNSSEKNVKPKNIV